MTTDIKKATELLEVVKKAQEEGKCFVLGDEVYSPADAFTAFLETMETDMAENGQTFAEYLEGVKACIHDAPTEYAIFTHGEVIQGTNFQAVDLSNDEATDILLRYANANGIDKRLCIAKVLRREVIAPGAIIAANFR